MLSTLLSITAMLISMAGIVHLCSTNPKRLRAHGILVSSRRPQSDQKRRQAQKRRRRAIFFAFTPPLLLGVMEAFAALILWIAAVPILAWMVVLYWPLPETE